MSRQKLIKNAKNGPFCASFWKPEACGQTVLPDRSVLIGKKLVENAKIQKFKMRHFEWSGQKLIKNVKKWSILASFWKPEACGQTVLPDRSVLMGQKLVENAKIQMWHFE